MKVTDHFRQRCLERLGPSVCPDTLAGVITTALDEGGNDTVRFACKTGDGRRVYRCLIEGKGDAYAIVERDRIALLTILTPGQIVGRPGKRKNKLLRGVLQ